MARALARKRVMDWAVESNGWAYSPRLNVGMNMPDAPVAGGARHRKCVSLASRNVDEVPPVRTQGPLEVVAWVPSNSSVQARKDKHTGLYYPKGMAFAYDLVAGALADAGGIDKDELAYRPHVRIVAASDPVVTVTERESWGLVEGGDLLVETDRRRYDFSVTACVEWVKRRADALGLSDDADVRGCLDVLEWNIGGYTTLPLWRIYQRRGSGFCCSWNTDGPRIAPFYRGWIDPKSHRVPKSARGVERGGVRHPVGDLLLFVGKVDGKAPVPCKSRSARRRRSGEDDVIVYRDLAAQWKLDEFNRRVFRRTRFSDTEYFPSMSDSAPAAVIIELPKLGVRLHAPLLRNYRACWVGDGELRKDLRGVDLK